MPCGLHRHYQGISIHAPRTGSDIHIYKEYPKASIFQSTLPARGATPAAAPAARGRRFQSTLPARGATRRRGKLFPQNLYFNPRSPHGERRHQRAAPAAGGGDFNPRSPHGERLYLKLSALRSGNFNPRSPHGERRQQKRLIQWRNYFNPRSPHGERRRQATETRRSSQFQSTLPARGATRGYDARSVAHACISIHAPRTGSDGGTGRNAARRRGFQSTLPARGATIPSATRAFGTSRFQSTLPARGATSAGIARKQAEKAFQSTLPARGATRVGRDAEDLTVGFQSTLPARGAT